jgi:hypothetical protein
MWKIYLACVLTGLIGCSTHHVLRVRCDKHLEPINSVQGSDPVHPFASRSGAAGNQTP